MCEAAFEAWLPEALKTYQCLKKRLDDSEDGFTEELLNEAEKNLLKLESEICKFHLQSTELKFQVCLISAVLNFELGRIVFRKCPEGAERYLKHAYEIVKYHSLNPDCVLLWISILTELTYLTSAMGKKEETEEYSAQNRLVNETYEFEDHQCIISLEDIFLSKRERQCPIPSISTCDSIYRALEKNSLYSILNSWLLTVMNIIGEENHESLEWSETVIRFAIFLIRTKTFRLARHILSCATHKVMECEKILKTKTDVREIWKQLEHINADISLWWSYYAMNLLKCSRNALLADGESVSLTIPDEISNIYGPLPEDEVKELESKVACTLAMTYEEAKQIFKFGKQHLDSCETHYVLNECTKSLKEFNSITSNLNTCLMHFENDLAELYNRSLNPSENEELNIIDVSHFPKARQEVLFTLGETYYRQASATWMLIRGSEPLPEHRMEMQSLANKVIGTFRTLLDCLLVANDKIPEIFPENCVELALNAWIYIAHAHLLMFKDTPGRIKSLKKAYNFYGDIINYIERNGQHEHFIQKDFAMVKETFFKLQKHTKEFDEHVANKTCCLQ